MSGISVGCGNGAVALVRNGFVDRMLGYDLAEVHIAQAQASAAALGLDDRIEFHNVDAFAAHSAPEFDLVYWNNSLHHMLDVPMALAGAATCCGRAACC